MTPVSFSNIRNKSVENYSVSFAKCTRGRQVQIHAPGTERVRLHCVFCPAVCIFTEQNNPTKRHRMGPVLPGHELGQFRSIKPVIPIRKGRTKLSQRRYKRERKMIWRLYHLHWIFSLGSQTTRPGNRCTTVKYVLISPPFLPHPPSPSVYVSFCMLLEPYGIYIYIYIYLTSDLHNEKHLSHVCNALLNSMFVFVHFDTNISTCTCVSISL